MDRTINVETMKQEIEDDRVTRNRLENACQKYNNPSSVHKIAGCTNTYTPSSAGK